MLALSLSAQAAKYAGDSFSLGVGARLLAMGGAAVAGPFDATAGYWNPAGMNYLSGRHIGAMHAETFGSLLNHDFIGYVGNRKDTASFFKSYGFYIYYLGGGGVKITEYDPQIQRPYVVREESHGDFLFSGSLSGKIFDRIDIGLTGKIIYRDLTTFSGYGFSADIGALYQPYDFARIGLTVTDIFSGYIHYSNGTSESIIPTVKPGLLLIRNYREFTGQFAVSGDIKFEGIREAAQYWLGELSLDTHFGLEVGYREMAFGRLGFDIGDFTAGVGFEIKRIKIDIAYLYNSYLDETIRLSGEYSF